MGQSNQRRTFLKGLVPRPRPSWARRWSSPRGPRRRRPAGGGGRPVGHRDALRLALEPVREDAVGLRVRPADQRDPKTFGYRPGLATEWKPSNELKTWTFKLRSGVKFHEGYGELTGGGREVHGRAKPQARRARRLGALLPRPARRIETPDKLTVVMHFKNRVWEAPHFTQFVGYQNITSKKYLE